MYYAAATGDENPLFLDDTREAGIIAPPMLAVSLTWPLSARVKDFWGKSDFPIEVLTRQVHYSEILRWHKSMRPGDRLRVQGRVAAILPHRAGTHLVLEYTARDKDDDIVFVERIGGFLRGVKCTDAGKGEVFPGLADAPAGNTAPLWSKKVAIPLLAPYIYDGLADVHFPIHVSPAFAKGVGLPGIIFHGTGTMALAVRELVREEADNNPQRLLAAQCRFTGMVMPDSEIRVDLLSRDVGDDRTMCHFVVRNEADKIVLNNGCVTIALT